MPKASRTTAADAVELDGYEGHFEDFGPYTFGDGREELYEAGDAYYAPPGHLPYLYAGSEVVEFSPTAELKTTLEVVERNMTAANA